MPEFVQSTTPVTHGYHVNLEAELLVELSRESLSRVLIERNLTATESIYVARLEAELQILKNNEYCGYFLIVADYVRWAKENGIAVGPGRGSGPCSLVGFALGITNIDPVKYNLPFERFVNPNRKSLPDFDLDFCGERYSEVTNYLLSKYGADRVAQISSNDNTPLPSRLVICDRPLAELTPLYSNPETGFPTARMTMEQIKTAGLVQFNVINQRALTIIQSTVLALAKSGTAIDIDNIALDNKNTYHLLSAGEASNITVLDSEHYKATLIAVEPERFENLYAVIALCYPNLRDHVSLYVERRQNPALIQYFHPALESITKETYGLILYQEQVMHIAHKVAGFSMAQGDLLRRALKDVSNEMENHAAIHPLKEKFIDGSINYGLTEAKATGLFDHIALSGPRYFNKSHAVAFAMIAYQTAWLKANHSSEFKHATSAL